MNLYGCVPASYFPSPSLTYWAHAASLAGLPSAESALTSASFALGLKKSQLPLTLCDVIQKSRSAASLRTSDDVTSSFHVTSRVTAPSSEAGAALNLHGHSQLHARLQLQQQQHRQQHQSHHHLQHRPFSTTPPPIGNGLAPLQALCDSDVSAFTAKTTPTSSSSSSTNDSKGSLKFGMSRILSDDFGKVKNEKENNFQLSSVPESCRSLPLCPCNSPACTAYARPPSPYPRGAIPSLSAVHALQPPNYPHSTSADALPGPYSILSTDSSSSSQPKRKRSWSRAVFSNLQRKGLEKRFEVQKYVTKPDRRQLAAMLGLTDAQVKVWFQNRRMKWRHAQQQGEKDKQIQQQEEQQGSQHSKQDGKNNDNKGSEKSAGTTPKGDDVSVRPVANGSTSPGQPTDRKANHPDHAGPGSPDNRRATNDGGSPHDASARLFAPRCTPERGINLAAPFDTRSEHAAEVSRCHGVKDASVYDEVKPRARDVSPLRHSSHSPSSGVDESFDDVIVDHKLDSDDGSRSGLEIDSDVDVNDDDDEYDNENDTAKLNRDVYDKDRERDDSGQFDDDVNMKEIDVDN